ncbi:MAG: Fic family protein [Nanoarchaeota archaeon]
MHIEKRKEKNGAKYYLAHSYREGLKVHKARKYLGRNLTPVLLKERKRKAEKLISDEISRYRIIKDPLTHQLSPKEIELVNDLEKRIPIEIRHLSEEQWSTFSRIFTYNTNAIEGSKLNSEEVGQILGEDSWPRKSKEDIAEAYGVSEAVKFIRRTKQHLSTELLRKIHYIVFRNSKPFAGELRKKGEEVVVMGSDGIIVHEGAPQPRVAYLLKELERWYALNKKRYPGLILAAVVHNQFENIHPFRDGNGRVGRLILNNILIKHKLPPINIGFNNRMEYYDTLQAYEENHDLRPTFNLFMKEYKALKKALGDYKHKKM